MNNALSCRISKIAGSFFGLGFFPVFPGTAASLVSVTAMYLLHRYLRIGILWELEIFFLLLLAGILAARGVLRHCGEHDPGWFVLDEIAGMWIALIFLPKDNIFILSVVFVLFRFFDIVKPWIIRRVDLMKSGFAVMLDDILAAVPAWAGGFIVWKLLC